MDVSTDREMTKPDCGSACHCCEGLMEVIQLDFSEPSEQSPLLVLVGLASSVDLCLEDILGCVDLYSFLLELPDRGCL